MLVLLLTGFSALAQIKNPVKWQREIVSQSDGQVRLVLMANIDTGWHVYSQHLERTDGPIATSIRWIPDPGYALLGKLDESATLTAYDSSYSMTLRYFEQQATLSQSIKLLTKQPITVRATLEYMVCNNTDCLPPDELDFSFPLNESKVASNPPPTQRGATTSPVPPTESIPETAYPETGWGIFIAGFLGGLLALLTPCVFPIIPLTVSFFTKRSKTRVHGIRNALFYGASIIGLYVGIGLLITVSLGPDALNALASNAWVNGAFFVIFVCFAFSFLGAFEITLPSSWLNRADAASDRAGLAGVFFMALTLSLVSFSCTGPIVGSLLVEAAVGGNILHPVLGMLGFSTALALPFGLLAAFPVWLNALPRSGGWLNSVKVVLGLLELALSLKFLSNVDLAYHWGLLTREVFIALWIILFTWLGLYLLGELRFRDDTKPLNYLPLPRFVLATITFAFVIYLIPGMFGAPLKLISGFPPPLFYNEGWSLTKPAVGSPTTSVIKGTHPESSPHGLPAFHDYDEAVSYAKTVHKPLLLDFTGWSCVNCRKMEDKVWIDERVLSTLRDQYVLVSLYVDDKTELPVAGQYVSPTTGKRIRTVGNRWSDLQTSRFQTNSQPFYVPISADGQRLSSPIGYEPDPGVYFEFLQRALRQFDS